jgi:hypothetical protein
MSRTLDTRVVACGEKTGIYNQESRCARTVTCRARQPQVLNPASQGFSEGRYGRFINPRQKYRLEIFSVIFIFVS